MLLFTTHFFHGPLESSNTRVFDFIQVLNSLSAIHQHVGASTIGTETPNLAGLGDIPAVFLGNLFSSVLWLISSVDFALKTAINQILQS